MADNFFLYWILPLLNLEWKILSLFNISFDHALSNKFLQGNLFLPLHTAGPPGWVPPGSATYTPGPHPGTGYCKWILCMVYSHCLLPVTWRWCTVLCKSNENVIRRNWQISGLFDKKCPSIIHLESFEENSDQRIFPLPIVLIDVNFRVGIRVYR